MNQGYLTQQEFMFAFPSVIIGISILALPTTVSQVTSYSDGWIAILLAGGIATFMAVLTVKIAAYFPGQPFLEYAAHLVTRPIAMFITAIYIMTVLVLCAMTLRSVAYITQQYLFESTPLEVVGLVFFLVVIYAVAGTRIGLFRLNMLFLPIIVIVFIIVGVFNMKYIETANLLPVFTTDMKSYITGTQASLTGYVGAGMGFFYGFMIPKPSHMTKKVIAGMSMTIGFYIFIFLISIGVFGNLVTGNLLLPTLELARKVDIPGAVFERVDAFAYTIWIMAIFNTMTILFDIAVLLFTSLFKKLSKATAIFILSPVLYFVGLFPKSMDIVSELTRFIGHFSLMFTGIVIILFYLIIKWKGISPHEAD